MTGKDEKHGEIETINRWIAEREEEQRHRDVYHDVVKDLIASADKNAFVSMEGHKRDSLLLLMEKTIRLAHNCAKEYDGAQGMRSKLQIGFRETLREYVVADLSFFEKIVSEEKIREEQRLKDEKKRAKAKAA